MIFFLPTPRTTCFTSYIKVQNESFEIPFKNTPPLNNKSYYECRDTFYCFRISANNFILFQNMIFPFYMRCVCLNEKTFIFRRRIDLRCICFTQSLTWKCYMNGIRNNPINIYIIYIYIIHSTYFIIASSML